MHTVLSRAGLSLIPCFLVLTTSPALADKNILTQTFDIPVAQCEGLQLAGVTYAFTVAGVPSLDCLAGTMIGPGNTNNIEAPNIEGTAAGVLHLTFRVPTTHFDFGVAQNTFNSPQSVVIDLNRPGAGRLRKEVPLTTTNDPGFVGGGFVYNGPAVKTATISFPVGATYTRFAVDNVSYFSPPGAE